MAPPMILKSHVVGVLGSAAEGTIDVMTSGGVCATTGGLAVQPWPLYANTTRE